MFEGSGFGVYGVGLKVRVSGFGFRVQGLGFRVEGLGIWVQGSGFREYSLRIHLGMKITTRCTGVPRS